MMKFSRVKTGFTMVCCVLMIGAGFIQKDREVPAMNAWEAESGTQAVTPVSIVGIAQSNKANARDIGDDDVLQLVREAVEKAGGLSSIVSDGDTVVLKPNLVGTGGKVPEVNGVSTDYRVTRAVARLVREINPSGYVVILEGSHLLTRDVYPVLNYTSEYIPEVDAIIPLFDVCGDWGEYDSDKLVSVVLPDSIRLYPDAKKPNKSEAIYLSKLYFDADVLISIPVLKNHGTSAVTGAIKNVGIGASPPSIYGDGWNGNGAAPNPGSGGGFAQKNPNNRNPGISHDLPYLHQWIHDFIMCRPIDYTVVDGLQGAQFGPGGGSKDQNKMNMRLIMAGSDPVASDAIAALIMGYDPAKVSHLVYLHNNKAGCADAKRIKVVGKKVHELKKKFDHNTDFAKAAMTSDFTAPVFAITSQHIAKHQLSLQLDVPDDVVLVEIAIDGTILHQNIISGFDDISVDVHAFSNPREIRVIAYDHYLNASEKSFTPTIQSGVQTVKTPVSKYGDDKTPYPLYGHLWNSGLAYSPRQIDLLANSLDYVVGGAGLSKNSAVLDAMHAANEKFQVIYYVGGWTMDYAAGWPYKMDLTYYVCGTLASDINEDTTRFIINAPSAARGLMAGDPGKKVTIWIRVENELMKVTEVSSTASYPITVTVERGFDGTSPAAHTAGLPVTTPLFGAKVEPGVRTGDIKFFVTPYGARKHQIEKNIEEALNLHADGVWIDILTGRLEAQGLFGNKPYTEWDYRTGSALTYVNDIQYTKEALNDMYVKYNERNGSYPVIYGNNVLFSSSHSNSSRAWIMQEEAGYERVLDGFCHENSWGHMTDSPGTSGSSRYYTAGNNRRYLQWHLGSAWEGNCRAIALLAQKSLPNQPMTINAGFKNKWFAEDLTDETRYNFHKYAYVSYLLCVDVMPDSAISCRMGISPMRVRGGKTDVEIEPFFYYDIGVPVTRYPAGEFTKYRHGAHSLYSRLFSHGLVLINPFATGMTEPVALSDITKNETVYYHPEQDNAVVDSVHLGSREAMILLTEKINTTDVGTTFNQPTEFALHQNYPNPFNPVTAIRYRLSGFSRVKIGVYDVRGQLVCVLVDEDQAAGGHAVRWNGTDNRGQPVASGVYFFRMEAESSGLFFHDVNKMMLLR